MVDLIRLSPCVSTAYPHMPTGRDPIILLIFRSGFYLFWNLFILLCGNSRRVVLFFPSADVSCPYLRKVTHAFAEGPRCFCTRWNSNTLTLRAKPHHMPSSAQGVAPFLPPCAPWCVSSTSYFSVGDNLLIISKIIKLGLSKSKGLIHLSPCVSNTYPQRRQDDISPF